MANPQQIAKLVKLRALGWSQQEIAEQIGLSRQAVANQLQRLKNESLKTNVDDVLTEALLGGLVAAAGGIGLAMILDALKKG